MLINDDILTLKPLTLADASEHLAGEDHELVKWLSGGVSTLADVTAWIERNQESWQTDGHNRNFGIWENQSGRLIGNIDANTNAAQAEGILPGDANVSYGLSPIGRGRGYATRSVLLICQYLKSIGIERAVIRADPENVRSHGVAERAGFVRDGEVIGSDGVTLLRWVLDLK